MFLNLERKLIPFVRWTARILGVLLIGVVALFMIGEGPPKPSELTLKETWAFVFWFLEMAGFLIAWKWELQGASLTAAGYVAFSWISGDFWMPPIFPLFALVPILFFYCYWRGSVLKLKDGAVVQT